MKTDAVTVLLLFAALMPLRCPADKPTLLEAENAPQGQIVADANASGGKYVAGGGDYRPLLVAPLPTGGDTWTVWARVRGTSVQLKGVAGDGKQREFAWAYDKPALWVWETLGRHTRAELGDKVLLIRGPGAGAGAGLDAVVLAADANFDPRPAFPKLSTVPAKISVDWGATTGRTTPLLFGSNDWGSLQSPKLTVGDAQTARLVARSRLAFLRIHNGGLSDSWSDKSAQSWVPARIKSVYDAPYLQGKTILQNIPGWPGWMKQQDRVLDPSEYDRYAQFCAGLVRIVNKQQGRKVRLWEPLNEQDQNYWARGKFDDLCVIYNKAAAAMKAVDPSIKVGGMAFTWDDPAKVEAFLKRCGRNVDFVSWHRYGGDGQETTDKLLTDTTGSMWVVERFREAMKKYAPGRTIPLVCDEYSLSYTWESPEKRQWTNVGAVWFASTLKHMADAGVDIAAQWNLRDGFYGLMDNDDTPRPALTVFTWANHALVGALVGTKSDQPMAEAMAVRRADGGRSLLLINKADVPVRVTLTMGGGGAARPGPWKTSRLDEKGTAEGTLAPAALYKPLTLPPHSLLLLRR